MLPRGLDFGDVVALARGEVGLEHQVRQSDNRIHRGADFMAHVCQKIRLHAGCFLGHLSCVTHFNLCLLSGGDVPADTQ
jgi:hypothetical protein